MLTPTPVTSVQVVTISGAAVTQTVTSTPTPYLNPNYAQEKPTVQRVSTGAIAGAVVGAVLGVALLLALGFFCLRRRRQTSTRPSNGINRNASVLSKVGLLSSARAADNEKDVDDSTPTGNSRNSFLHGSLTDYDGTPIAAPASTYETSAQADARRNSKPLLYDQRLNPAALMQNWQANGSRTSVNTMQDQRDYSRPLGVTNPDPTD